MLPPSPPSPHTPIARALPLAQDAQGWSLVSNAGGNGSTQHAPSHLLRTSTRPLLPPFPPHIHTHPLCLCSALAQDAQGWSLVSNAVGNGNAKVCSILLEALETVAEPSIGLVCAVPSTQLTRVVLDRADDDPLLGNNFKGGACIRERARHVYERVCGA